MPFFNRRRALATIIIGGLYASPVAAADCPFSSDILKGTQPTATGFGFAEGPVWHEGRWLFSDIFADQILEMDENGEARPVHAPSGWANGGAVLPDGRLVSARHNRSIAIWDTDGSANIIATHFNGKRLNSPNDVAIDAAGAILFTDPTYGITGYGPEKAEEEQTVRGVYRITLGEDTRPEPVLLTGDFTAPNGIAFDHAGSFLYISDTQKGTVTRFSYDVGPDGARLSDPAIIAVPGPQIDGMAIDRSDRLYVAQEGGVGVYDISAVANDLAPQICVFGIQEIHVSNVAINATSAFVTATDRVFIIPLAD